MRYKSSTDEYRIVTNGNKFRVQYRPFGWLRIVFFWGWTTLNDDYYNTADALRSIDGQMTADEKRHADKFSRWKEVE